MQRVGFDHVLWNLLSFLIYTSHHIDILPKVAAPDPYAGKLTDLDVDKDGKVQMYRKMGQEERDKVVQNGKLQPNEPNRQSGKIDVSHLFNAMFFQGAHFFHLIPLLELSPNLGVLFRGSFWVWEGGVGGGGVE